MYRRIAPRLVLCALLASCGPDDRGTQSEGITGSRTANSMDCQMSSQAKCDAIMRGIAYLQTHPAGVCQNLGDLLHGRFVDAGGTGFLEDGTIGVGMGVRMDSVGSATPSGWAPSDGYIRIHPDWWGLPNSSDPQLTAWALAHEEGGHMTGEDGPDHNTVTLPPS